MATTLRSRLDRAAKQWAALQDRRDARNVAVLLDLGITQDMPIDAWPQNVKDGIRAHGWTLQAAYDLLQRWHDTVDDRTIIVRWMDGETWNGQGEAPLMVIAPGLLDKLLPDGTELQPNVTPDDQVTLPDAPKPEVTTDAPTWQQRKERFERETHQHERQRRLFPHELAERRRQRRPNWKVL